MGRSTLASLFIKMSFLPFCIAIFVLLGYNTVRNLDNNNKMASHEAKNIARLMSVIAAQRPLPVDLMSEQVDILLKASDALVSVNFFPLEQTLPKESNHIKLFDTYLSRHAAVMVNDDSEERATLIGYISVTMDLTKSRQPIIRNALTELVFSAAILLGLFVVLLYVFSGPTSVVRHLVGMSRRVVEGDYGIELVDHKRSQTQEFRLFENALLALATKVRLMEKSAAETVQENQMLKRRERSLSHRQTTFQSLVTHELKTPLNAISGGLQLLETQKLDMASVDSLSLIRKGHNRLSSLLDNIIELNKLQQGNVIVSDVRFNPENILRGLAHKYSQVCLQKGIQLSIDIKHTSIQLIGDQEKITQTLDFLVDNAIKFTPQGSVTLVSHLIYSSDESLHWQCDVVDTGIGIEDALQDDVFNPYVQADSSKSREYEGSGLGLALAKKLTQLMRGRLTLTSELNEGSQFKLLIPVKDAAKQGSTLSLHGIKMMHVHSGKTSDFAHALTKLGATASHFDSTQNASVALLNENIDVVTICAQIAPKAACEFATQVREQEFTHRCLMVYFVPDSHELDRLWLSSAGIDRWITFTSMDDFVTKIHRWID